MEGCGDYGEGRHARRKCEQCLRSMVRYYVRLSHPQAPTVQVGMECATHLLEGYEEVLARVQAELSEVPPGEFVSTSDWLGEHDAELAEEERREAFAAMQREIAAEAEHAARIAKQQAEAEAARLQAEWDAAHPVKARLRKRQEAREAQRIKEHLEWTECKRVMGWKLSKEKKRWHCTVGKYHVIILDPNEWSVAYKYMYWPEAEPDAKPTYSQGYASEAQAGLASLTLRSR